MNKTFKALALATVASTFALSASAAEVTLRVQHFISNKGAIPAHFILPWAEKVEKDSGGRIDVEAQRRGTSVYFPGTVIPMLPPRISDDLCSLRPGVERLVQTVILDLDPEGEPVKVRFADGLIRSAARLMTRSDSAPNAASCCAVERASAAPDAPETPRTMRGGIMG